MTEQAQTLSSPQAVVGSDPGCLTEIFRDEVNLTIWERSLEASCRHFVDQLLASEGRLEAVQSLEPNDPASSLLPAWTQGWSGRDAWLADLEELLAMYRCLFEPDAVGVRLHVLSGTMCPRFHVDQVPARLLCTYSGSGTEWLPERHVTRNGQSMRLPDQNASADVIETLAEGAVGIFKGEAWCGNEGRGAVHRSPSVPEGEKRLLIALDWL